MSHLLIMPYIEYHYSQKHKGKKRLRETKQEGATKRRRGIEAFYFPINKTPWYQRPRVLPPVPALESNMPRGYRMASPVFRRYRKKRLRTRFIKKKRGYGSFGNVRSKMARRGRGRRSKTPSKFTRAVQKVVKHTYGPLMLEKNITTNQTISAVNKVAYVSTEIGSPLTYHNLLNNRYIEVGKADDLTIREEVFDLRAQKRVFFEVSETKKVTIRVGSKVPAKVIAYWCKPKCRTDLLPIGAITAGLDQMAGSDAGWEDEVCWYPKHSPEFRRLYTVYKTKVLNMEPGGESVLYIKNEPYRFSEDFFDQHGTAEPMWPQTSRFLLLRIQGVVGNDTSTGVGIASAQIDKVIERTLRFRFPTAALTVQRWACATTLTTPTIVVMADDPVDEPL